MSQSQQVSSEIAGFFQDPDASSAVVMAAQRIAAPVVKGVTLTDDELGMGGGVRVVMFILDASPSMIPVADALRDGFNNDFKPAVEAAREDDISALRVGGVAFSSGEPIQIWATTDSSGQKTYFHPFNKLPVLTKADYDPERGYGTDLHNALLKGSALALRYAGELQAEMGVDVDVDIIALSDGANNGAPLDPSGVKQMIVGRDDTRVRYVFFYFDTNEGLRDPKGYATNQLGIPAEQVETFLSEPTVAKPGESDEEAEERAKAEMASRFRRLMAVMSRVSAAKNTSAVFATAAVMEDDELV